MVQRYLLSRQRPAFTIAAVLVAAFAAIAFAVVRGHTTQFDTGVLLAIHAYAIAPLDVVMVLIASMGDISTVLALSLLVSAVLYQQHRQREILYLFFAVGGAIALNAVLKLIFQRERPALWELIVHESTFSFPSGHALITSAFIVMIICIVWQSRWRAVALSIGSLYIALVGFSRLYLGVHYPTDVVAGWCIGVAWALLVYVVAKRYLRRPQKTIVS